MRSTSSSLVVISLLALAVAACGTSGDTSPGDGTLAGDPSRAPSPSGSDGGPPTAPAVPQTPSNDELTEPFGVFVSTSGTDNGDGTRAHPLARIQSAIDLAKSIGKRVYVCSGVYREALVIADSISVIGGLDCARSDAWRTGAPRVRLESPTSPAITAKDITSPTRLEALDVSAPTATAPGASSIGLHAMRANALVVAASRVAAAAGAKGEDGTDGVQLANSGVINGGAVLEQRDCTLYGGCTDALNVTRALPGGAGGVNVCVGAAGFEPESGSTGGTGGLFTVKEVTVEVAGVLQKNLSLRTYGNLASNEVGVAIARTGASGADGMDGPAPEATGTVSDDGYQPANGTAGENGGTGKGGIGGAGMAPDTLLIKDHLVRGWAGAGGGAGGCPGLAGTPGKGGGASIAALLIDSAVTFDASELASGASGAGGLGTMGSMPTTGGTAGPNAYAAQRPLLSAQPGGRGGLAGVSTNGSNGPSVAIAHKGVAPVIKGGTVLKPGAGAPAIGARSRDALGVTKTIPATPAGVSKDILAL